MKHDLIFCDSEVYQDDWLFCFEFLNGDRISFHNDQAGLIKFVKEHKNDVFVGYNIRGYDQWILKGICVGMNPKFINDKIIKEDTPGWKVLQGKYPPSFNFYDAMTERIGLKKLEGHMGVSIIECSVPFNIERPLTKEELEEVEFYCWSDVSELKRVFFERFNEFRAHYHLIQKFELPIQDFRFTKTQLAAKILEAKKRPKSDDEFDLIIPENLKLEKYKFVVDWFLDPANHELDKDGKPFKSLIIEIGGVKHSIRWGGTHSIDLVVCWEWDGEEQKMLILDVKSYYPTLILLYGLLPRSVENAVKYAKIYEDRLTYKSNKDPIADALKALLNSVFGATIYPGSNLYDPRQGRNICVLGQLFLLDLLEKLEPFVKIINSNTDGLCVHPHNEECYEKCQEICQEWQERTGMVLEFENVIKCFQKDVNNYIWVTDSDKNNIKARGDYKKPSVLKCDLGIIPVAVTNYFVYGIPVNESISANSDNLKLFQRIISTGSFEAFCDPSGKEFDFRVARWFACNKAAMSTNLRWKTASGKAERIPNTTPNGVILNDDIQGKKVPSWLDTEFYAKMIRSHIKIIEEGKRPQKSLSDF